MNWRSRVLRLLRINYYLPLTGLLVCTLGGGIGKPSFPVESSYTLPYSDRITLLSGLPTAKRVKADSPDLIFQQALEWYHKGTVVGFEQAIPLLKNAYQLYQEQGQVQQSALSGLLLGIIYKNLGQLEPSLEYVQQALAFYEQSTDPVGMADSLNQMGLIYQIQADMDAALNAYSLALQHYQQVEDRGGEAYTFNNIGVVYDRLGQYQQALDYYNRALPLWREVEDGYGEAATLNNIGIIYDHLGDYDPSLHAYEQALLTYRTLEDRLGMARTLNNIGLYYDAVKLPQQALTYYERALPLWEEVGDRPGQASTLNNMGYVWADRGQWEKSLGYYEQALPLWEEVGNRKGKASTLNNLGYVYANQGKPDKALEQYQQALSIRQEIGDRPKEALSLYRIAQVQQEQGGLEEALETLKPAIAIIEDMRINVASQELRTSFFASKQDYYEFYIDLLMQLHQKSPQHGYDAQALQVSEQSRARSLLDILAEAQGDVSAGVNPTLLEQKKSLQKQLSLQEERRIQILSRSHTEREAQVIEEKIKTLLDQYRAVQALIRVSSPRYAALTQPEPLTLEEIQTQVLDEDTLLLEYFLGKERSTLWLVSSTEIKSYELPGRETIEQSARKFRDALTIPTQRIRRNVLEATAIQLSEQILGPVAEELGNKRLAIAGHGALQYVPFAALAVPGLQEYKPLIANRELVNLPSASTVAILRRETQGRKPAPKTLAVLADPVFGQNDGRVSTRGTSKAQPLPPDLERSARESGVLFDRLPYTHQEAESILALVPAPERLEGFGFSASRKLAASDELSQYQIIHFATHGLMNSTNPALSGLVFSLVNADGEPLNGFLRLHEIFNLNLPSELVVLSACETGLGQNIKGEGLIGLTRGFMYAGAPRLVVSLWSVDDQATAKLMIDFYQTLLAEGKSPSQALREAQLKMWETSQWWQPYYWAAFTLQGEWNH
ncbi:CHAT domain-containing tetratricopeptide repeat protein [Roseofilum sp. Belize Diploria]|uniref:CHAT domain-containing protein n=1 Tax=Roseofilum sp. Belize Diploria TaxID=2821501 RepID=UPI001B07728C|nr:CHAT domain-containing tetratricopeptide repeat protein [Roseofilum sp. Belize Diploria]MBP0009620.1 tetratricopeptide repeat protein [Roseofilum sp. Belize Diploria]